MVSIETQEIIIAALLKNSHLFSISRDEMTDGYFTYAPAKVIFKALQTYYKKYSTLPSLNELLITIEDCYYPQVGASLPDIKDVCCKLWEYQEPEESFIMDKLTDFIRKVRSSAALQKFLKQAEMTKNLESDSTVADLIQSLDVQLSPTKIYFMNNPAQMLEARQNAVGTTDQSRIIKSVLPSLNTCLMFGGYQPGTVNMVLAPPGTGKSMFLINEGVNAAKQGFSVLHVFIGDMNEYDGFVRYTSCISGMPQNQFVMKTPDEQQAIVNFCEQQYNHIYDHFALVAYPSLSLTAETLIEEINKFEKQLNKDFDMIIIDYPDNLIQDGVSLYTDGGVLYSNLERMARLTKSVVLVASQPSKVYWNAPIIPMEAAAESAKKQMCVDIMLTFNTEFRGADFGTVLLAKVRKGEVGKIIRVKTEFAKCLLEEIPEASYNAMKANYANTINNNHSNNKGVTP